MDVLQRDITEEVRRTLEAMLKMPEGQLHIHARFDTFGVDSIVAMQLISKLSKQFDTPITPAQFSEITNIKELADYIAYAGAEPQPEPGTIPVEDPAPAANQRVIARKAAAGMRIPARDPGMRTRKFLDFVAQTYSVDLSGREFGTAKQIVDVLLREHPDDMLQRSGSSGGSAAVARQQHTRQKHQGALDRSVAVIGMSARFPDAGDLSAFWSNLENEKRSIREIDAARWDWRQHYSDKPGKGKSSSKWGALIDDVACFDGSFFNIPDVEARFMDPQERLLYQETYQAFQDAGLNVESLAGSSTSVFVGYEFAEYEQMLREGAAHLPNTPAFGSSSPAYYLANRLSYVFDLRGASEAINLNCASSTAAVARAYHSVQSGESDFAVAAGVSLNLLPGDYIAESQYGLLSPTGTCAVFDDDANGYTRGEGVGVVILRRLDDALRDRSQIYGLIRGCHQNNRGRAPSISAINHDSLTDVIATCYAKAGVDPRDVSYIEVDGYSTKWGDSFEFEGIKNVFKGLPIEGKTCALGSLKGNIGHLEPASGIAGIIKVLLSMRHKRFPPTITKKTISEFIDIDDASHPLYIADASLKFESLRRGRAAPVKAGVSSFSDSGCNVHILFEEHVPSPAAPVKPEAQMPQLFLLSARSRERLYAYLERFADHLSAALPATSFTDMIHTLQIGREAMTARAAIIASSGEELLGKIRWLCKASSADPAAMAERDIFQCDGQPAQNSIANALTPPMVERQVLESARTNDWLQIAVLWVHGVKVPWEKCWEGRDARFVSLPGYPFLEQRHWIDSPVVAPESLQGTDASPAESSQASAPGIAEPSTQQRQWKFSTSRGTESSGIHLSAEEKIELLIRQEIASQIGVPIDRVQSSMSYLELGLNSLGIVNVIRRINQVLGTKLSPGVVVQHTDMRAFSRFLADTQRDKVDALSVVEVPSTSAERTHSFVDAQEHFRGIDGGGLAPAPAGAEEMHTGLLSSVNEAIDDYEKWSV